MYNQYPIMLSLKDAAKLSGLSYYELRRLCLEGRVPHVRVGSRGGKFLINWKELQAYLAMSGRL